MRKVLANSLFIHFLVALGIFALLGYIATDNKYLLLGIAMSFAGAICGSFIKVIDTVKSK